MRDRFPETAHEAMNYLFRAYYHLRNQDVKGTLEPRSRIVGCMGILAREISEVAA